MNTIFIGIAGGTGSGKTTLTEHLKQHFGDDISVVHHDSYYKHQDLPFEERCKQNYDHPDAFETDLMVKQLKELKSGKAIHCPVYSYADHQRHRGNRTHSAEQGRHRRGHSHLSGSHAA